MLLLVIDADLDQATGIAPRFDARRHERHKTLRRYARESNISTCLDTQAMELAMPGATSKGHLELPWSKLHSPSAEHFTPKRIEQIAEAIVGQVVDGDYAEVKAPPTTWQMVQASGQRLMWHSRANCGST